MNLDQLDRVAECQFYEAWKGECGETIEEWGPILPLCDEHRGTMCRSCGDQATTQCGSAGSLVCGQPLCETCECPSHGCTGHGTTREYMIPGSQRGSGDGDVVSDLTDEYSNIVQKLVDDEDIERFADGTVDGIDITVEKSWYRTKSQEKSWKVQADAVSKDRPGERKTFETAREADEYFETLVERYGLTEL